MPGFQPATDGVNFPQKAYANLGDASAYTGVAFFVPDTPSGASLVVSDGSSWRVFARGVVAQSYMLTDADKGIATFNYKLTAPPVPSISLEDPTGGGRLSFSIMSRTNTQLVVKATRGIVLPGALTSLLGFDPFSGGLVSGVTVHFIGVPTT